MKHYLENSGRFGSLPSFAGMSAYVQFSRLSGASASILRLTSVFLCLCLLFLSGCTRDDFGVAKNSINFSIESGSPSTKLSGSSFEGKSSAPTQSYNLKQESSGLGFGNLFLTVEANDAIFDFSEPEVQQPLSSESSDAVPYEQSSLTHYGDKIKDASGKTIHQYIVWDNADELTIWSNVAQNSLGLNHETYVIQGTPVNSGNKSKASIICKTAGLNWGTGEHRFVGFFPALSSSPTASSNQSYTDCSLPKQQNAIRSGSGSNVYLPELDKYGYMVGQTVVNPKENITLGFSPMFSAIEFSLKSESGVSMALNRVKVSTSGDAYLSSLTSSTGNYRIGYDFSTNSVMAEMVSPSTSSSKEVILSFFEEDGTTPAKPVVTSSEATSFVVLLSGAEDLSNLSVTFEVDITNTSTGVTLANQTRRLDLKQNGTFITIPARSKVIVSNLAPSLWNYDFFVTDPTDLTYHTGISETAKVTSYRRNIITGAEEAVGWSVEGFYATNEDALSKTNRIASGRGIDSTRVISRAYSNFISTMTPKANSSKDTTVSFAYETKEERLTSGGGSLTSLQRERILANGTVGSVNDFFNLANPKGVVGPNYIKESANTYIVNARGYYKIPLVMGNGVKNGAPNTSAYNLSYFEDYKGNNITSPYLHRSSTAAKTPTVVLTSRSDIIESDKKIPKNQSSKLDGVYYYTAKLTGSSTSVITYESGVYWLNFHVESEYPGVDYLTVLDQDSVVMWNYTIWLTDYVPFNYPGYDASLDKDIQLTSFSDISDPAGTPLTVHVMPRNLGAVYSNYQLYSYPSAELFVRYEQTGSGKVAVMHIEKPGYTPSSSSLSIPFTEGAVECAQLYYNWGRKDPLFHYAAGRTNGSYFGYSSNPTTSYINTNGNGFPVSETIKHPYCWFNVTQPPLTYNKWSLYSSDHFWGGGYITDQAVKKTIYDPSPAGYTVPRKNAFEGFRTKAAAEGNVEGWMQQRKNSPGPFYGARSSYPSYAGVYFYNVYTSSEPGTGSDAVVYFPATEDILCPFASYSKGSMSEVTFSRYSSISDFGYYLHNVYLWTATSNSTSTWGGNRVAFMLRVSAHAFDIPRVTGDNNENMRALAKPIRCTRDEFYVE